MLVSLRLLRRLLRWPIALVGRHPHAAALVLLVAGASIATAAWKAHDYIENDPRFCLSCHSMGDAFDRWRQSVHGSVNCHACHQSAVKNDMYNLWLTVIEQQTDVPGHAWVPSERCLSCHVREDPAGDASVGHRTHAGDAGIACTTCHSRGIHDFVVPEDTCLDCHAGLVVQAAAMGRFHCLQCHSFTSEQAESIHETASDACRRCHVDLGVGDAQLPADPSSPHYDLACSGCHRPHDAARPTRETCALCHAEASSLLGHGNPGHGDCLACHRSHAWVAPARAQCESCHARTDADHLAEAEGLACTECHDFGTAAPPR